MRVIVAIAAAVAAASPIQAEIGSAITIAGYQPERGGTAIWDGGQTSVKQTRFLRGARLATLASSGRAVAYIRYTGDGFDLFHTGVDAGFEARLAHVSGSRLTAIAVAPDSRTVAFATPRGIELTSIVPGGKRRVLPWPAWWRGSTLQGLQYSPDGTSIAFSRTWGDGRSGTLRNELALVRLDGTGSRSLATNPMPYSAQYRPAFSPDGRTIAFAAADGSISTVPLVGGAVVRVTPPPRAGSDSGPLFSPDGATIAFTRGPDVYLVSTDGSHPRRLTTRSRVLAWSPDGASLLVFHRDRFVVVAADAGTETTLARVGVQYDLSPARWR
jgi:dipeptidyl aminopeptidase/acylaminoacyl peptidase